MRSEGEMQGGERKDWVGSKEGPGPKTILAIVAAVLVLVFGLQNLDAANIRFLFWDLDTAVVIVIAVSAGLGFLIGWLLGRGSGRRRVLEDLTDR